MTGTLGELLRSARAQQGWDQAELARQLGNVRQQTVSRWELGTSRPRRAMIPQIAKALEVEVQVLFEAAGYGSPLGPEARVLPPVLPLLTELPMHELAEDVFERFATDLAHLLYPPPSDVHGYGSRGHKQDGIDVEVRHPKGKPTGIQCKRMQDFGPADVQQAVKALTLDVRECLIFLTRVASPGARKEIAKHANWRLWDRVDISRSVFYLADRDAAIRLVEKYFRGYREAFFGIAQPSPWETTEDFFRPLTGTPVFTHDWSLVGRAKELSALDTFLGDSAGRLAVLVGPGGLGKTRLLREFALGAVLQHDFTVRFVATETPVEPAQFEQLPVTDRLLVMIDDAHARSDVAAIVKGVLRQRPHAKIAISVRPYARPQLVNDLRNIGIHLDDCITLVLEELTTSEAQSLAREILGDNGPPGLTELLAAIAPDCPLIIVVGASLIKRGSLDPRHLHTSDRIRGEILRAFRDAMTADAGTGDSDMRRQVLEAVAALQPFRIDDGALQATISALTGRPFDQVMPYLKSLEGAGVLLRRGGSLRVVPDLLGDAILAAACVDTDSGIRTGYLERLYEAADGTALAHAFINASRVDWQIGRDRQSRRSLVEPLWAHINNEFARADIQGRVALLEMLRKVAAFQPAPTLVLVRWALANPAEDDDVPLARLYALTHRDVLNELPPLLESVAYHLEHLEEAAELLWQLAKHDNRETSRNPDHPIRILARIMEYSPSTPPEYRERLLMVATLWFDREDLADSPYSPFDILEPLLATMGSSEASDGLSLTIRRYILTPAATGALREGVVDLAFAELKSDDPKRAARAAAVIDNATTYPIPIDPASQDHWTTVFVRIFDRVASTAAYAHLIPAAVIGLRRALKWHCEHSTTATQAAGRAAWDALPNSLEHQFALVIHDGWGALLLGDDDLVTREDEKEAQFAAIAAAAIAEWSDAEIVGRLEQALVDERRAFGQDIPHATNFTWTLARTRPSIVEELCRRVLDDSDSPLCGLIPAALGRLLEARPDDGLALAQVLLDTGGDVIARHVASTFSWGRGGRAQLIDGEADLLRSLLARSDPQVRRLAIAAGRVLHRTNPKLVAELVTNVQFSDSPALADEVAASFEPPSSLRWADLSTAQAAALMEQLRVCLSIDTFNIHRLLDHVSMHDPEAVARLLMGRVELWEQDDCPAEFVPLPHVWYCQPRFSVHQQYGVLLRALLLWLADGLDSWKRRFVGPDVFAFVADGFDQEIMSVLREALGSNEPKAIGAAGSILSKAPRTLVWDEVEFVCGALRAAQRHGDRCVQQVGGGLHEATTTGFRMGSVGQPYIEDVEQRDKATEILSSLQRGSIEAQFYQSLIKTAEQRISWDSHSDERLTDRRDW